MTTKYYKTVIKVTVLSNDPYADQFFTLKTIHYDINEGHSSGIFEIESEKEITKEEAHKLLIEQGSDENFLDNFDDEIESQNQLML